LTCHLASTPELMDSPMGGILTSRRGMVGNSFSVAYDGLIKG
jgi:hypothetical protein